MAQVGVEVQNDLAALSTTCNVLANSIAVPTAEENRNAVESQKTECKNFLNTIRERINLISDLIVHR